MRRTVTRVAASFGLSVALAACGGPAPEAPAAPASAAAPRVEEHFFRGTRVLHPAPAPEIDLTDQYGQPFRLSEQRGRVVLVFFGYVQCPDVCPATLSTWSKVADRLGDARRDVRFVFVTVDPERDSAERLRRHMEIFAPDFIGLTGTREALEAAWRGYGVSPEKMTFTANPGGYLVEHSSLTFLIDPAGTLLLQFDFDARADDVLEDVRWLLDHRSAADAPHDATLVADDVWSRPAAGPGVVYLSLANDGARDDRLIEVRSEVAESAEIHRTTLEAGRAHMAPVTDGVEIPAGGDVRFEPGGLHVMLLGLRRELRAGDRFPVELRFASGAELTVEAEVRTP